MSWFGFWIFMTVFCIVDYNLYLKGNDTLFWKYKTPIELELQKRIVENYGNKSLGKATLEANFIYESALADIARFGSSEGDTKVDPPRFQVARDALSKVRKLKGDE